MKAFSYIKSHKVISAVVATTLLASVGVVSYALTSTETAQKEQEIVASKPDTKKNETKIVEAPVETEVAEVKRDEAVVKATPVNIAPEPKQPEVKVQSTKQLFEKHFDLNKQFEMDCYEAITTQYANRFTENVRERNIKALTAFSSLCATGIKVEDKRINTSGGTNFLDMFRNADGSTSSFFDSDAAKARW